MLTTDKIVARMIDRAMHTTDPHEYARLALRAAYCRSNELASALVETPVCYMAETLETIGNDSGE